MGVMENTSGAINASFSSPVRELLNQERRELYTGGEGNLGVIRILSWNIAGLKKKLAIPEWN